MTDWKEDWWKHGLLSDQAIRTHPDLVINPFHDGPCPAGVISYGLTSFGYDLRVGDRYKVFTPARCSTVDPKNFDDRTVIDVVGDYCLIPPNSFALAEAIEWIEMPRYLLGLCIGKSSYARCGIVTALTPIEPEWKGRLTIEISNTTPLPAKIYSGEGICQVLFFHSPYPVETSYNDKKGVYQNQQGLMLPKVK